MSEIKDDVNSRGEREIKDDANSGSDIASNARYQRVRERWRYKVAMTTARKAQT